MEEYILDDFENKNNFISREFAFHEGIFPYQMISSTKVLNFLLTI